MALKRLGLLALPFMSVGLADVACRATTLCEQGACAESVEPAGGSSGTGGNDDNDDNGDGDNGSNTTSSGTAGAPGESGAAGQETGAEAGAGAAGAPGGLICPEGYGDCDGSSFTGCETNLEWTQRHCGVCGNRCEGGCYGGRCLQALHIANVQPTSMVSSTTFAFLLVSASPDKLMKLTFKDGTLHELTGVPWLSELSLSSDRVYVWDDSHEGGGSGLYSMPLAGTDLKSEPVKDAVSFGASEKGAYYVEEQQDPETVDDVNRLWFRPRADVPWELLSEGIADIELISSSYAGVIMRRYVEEEGARLFLLDGHDIVDYGLEPFDVREAVATETDIVVLGSSSGQSQLAWIERGGASKTYALSSEPRGQFRQLHVDVYNVALCFYEHGQSFLQWFGDEGVIGSRVGLPRLSDVASADYDTVWHFHLTNSVMPSFTRSSGARSAE